MLQNSSCLSKFPFKYNINFLWNIYKKILFLLFLWNYKGKCVICKEPTMSALNPSYQVIPKEVNTLNKSFIQRDIKLQKEIKKIKDLLSRYPEENFFYVKNGKYQKWFSYKKGNTTYIPKSQKDTACKLARKSFLTAYLNDLNNESKAIQYYLKYYDPEHCQSTKLLLDPIYQELLNHQFVPLNEELEVWKNAPFVQNPYYPEQKIHPSPSGNMLRSKSELMIDKHLYEAQLPFRYEAVLEIGNHTFYPDFTIRHPDTGETIYWEHFGMMDDPKYLAKFSNKIGLYASQGIILSKNLIATVETKDSPLSIFTVDKLIDSYFG